MNFAVYPNNGYFSIQEVVLEKVDIASMPLNCTSQRRQDILKNKTDHNPIIV